MRVKLLHEAARLPSKATSGSAGYDLHCIESGVIHSGQTKAFRTGISLEIPGGCAGLLCSRSGTAKKGVFVTNGPGVIDSDYRGEIIVLLSLVSESIFGLHRVSEGDRIAQLVIVQIPQIEIQPAESLEGTLRGEGGFGSTGK